MENEGEGLLPLKGALPDMVADTEKFVSLQQLYQTFIKLKRLIL